MAVIVAPLAAVATTVGVIVAAGGAGGCIGAGACKRAGTLQAGVRLRASAPARLLRGTLAPVGATQSAQAAGSELAVTLRRVIDPLRGSGARPPAGDRAVGVVFEIVNRGPEIYDSSATADIHLLASAGSVTPLLATRGVCRTPTQDFDRYMAAGVERVGCVVFAVARRAALDAVRFTPYGQRRRRMTWAP